MSVTMIDTPPNTLKILMTADAVGGVWQYCVDLISGLARGGIEVLVATMGPRASAEQKARLTSLPGVTVAESDYALEWMNQPWAAVDAAGEWLQQLADKFQPHIVHLNGYAHAALPWKCPILTLAHSCVFSWWRSVHDCAPGPEWSEYKKRVSDGLAASAAVVCPTDAFAESLQTEYAFNAAGKLRTIHNFSRSKRFERGTKLEFCLSAGRFWDPAKNLTLLDRIAPSLPWPVRVAGQQHGPDGREVEAKHVRLLGALPHTDVVAYMHAASVFAHPALYEPFGLAVLEAARARCCLVLADIPSLRELWEDAAVFVDPRDEERWTVELNRVCSSPEKRDKLAEQAYVRSAQYCAVRSIDAYIDLYRELAPHVGFLRKGVAA